MSLSLDYITGVCYRERWMARHRIAGEIDCGIVIVTQNRNPVPDLINGNVLNDGLIRNLPANSCVEVPCIVYGRCITPQAVADLPPHLPAIMQNSINVQTFTVEAMITGKKAYVYHAVMMDPHTGAKLNLDQIWKMVDELLDAHAGWLPRLN